jgi:hypothetical protein
VKAGGKLGLLFDPEDGGDVPPKRRLTFNGLQGVISQKTVFFITTGVRTSNPTLRQMFGLLAAGTLYVW